MSAASPRRATSAMIAAAAASTSSETSRFAERSAENLFSKLESLALSLSGIGNPAEALDPAADLLGTRLQGGTVDDEARAHLGDALDLDEPIGAQGRAGLDEVDDIAREAEQRRQLHRTIELDAFRLDAAPGEMAASDLWIFGGDADMAPTRRILAPCILRGCRN